MKWFVYLFSLYILILSGIPCNADDDCCTDEMSATSVPYKQTGDVDHKPACPCSPFFACNACHGVVIPNNSIEFLKVPLPVAKQPYNYTAQPLLDFPSTIWQPPKTA